MVLPGPMTDPALTPVKSMLCAAAELALISLTVYLTPCLSTAGFLMTNLKSFIVTVIVFAAGCCERANAPAAMTPTPTATTATTRAMRCFIEMTLLRTSDRRIRSLSVAFGPETTSARQFLAGRHRERAGEPALSRTRTFGRVLRKRERVEVGSVLDLLRAGAGRQRVATRVDGHVLLPVGRVGRGRARDARSEQRRAPDELAVRRVVRLEVPVGAADEDEGARPRHDAAVAQVADRERVRPHPPVRAHVHRDDLALCLLRRRALLGEEPVDLEEVAERLQLRGLRLRECLPGALGVLRADVHVAGLRRDARRRPVRSAERRRSEHRVLLLVVRRVDAAGLDRLAIGRLPLLPLRRVARALCRERLPHRNRLRRIRVLRRVLRELLLIDTDQRLAVRAVEDVHPAGLAGLSEAVPQLTLVVDVEEHDRVRSGVVVPDVVVDLLVVPLVRPGRRVQRHDRLREELLARATDVAVVRDRVADAHVHRVQGRVDGELRPDRAAARVGAMLRPGLRSDLAPRRDDVERPLDLAGLGVERDGLGPCAEVTAGRADDEPAVVVGRRAGEEVALLEVADDGLPDDASGRLVEADDAPVGLRHVDLAVADDDAAAGRQAGREALGLLRFVVPLSLAAHGVEGKDVAPRVRHVDGALIDHGTRLGERAGEVLLAFRGDRYARVPRALQVLRVRRVDLVQRRVLPVPDIATRGEPVGRWLRRQLAARERGDRCDVLPRRRCR